MEKQIQTEKPGPIFDGDVMCAMDSNWNLADWEWFLWNETNFSWNIRIVFCCCWCFVFTFRWRWTLAVCARVCASARYCMRFLFVLFCSFVIYFVCCFFIVAIAIIGDKWKWRKKQQCSQVKVSFSLALAWTTTTNATHTHIMHSTTVATAAVASIGCYYFSRTSEWTNKQPNEREEGEKKQNTKHSHIPTIACIQTQASERNASHECVFCISFSK